MRAGQGWEAALGWAAAEVTVGKGWAMGEMEGWGASKVKVGCKVRVGWAMAEEAMALVGEEMG